MPRASIRLRCGNTRIQNLREYAVYSRSFLFTVKSRFPAAELLRPAVGQAQQQGEILVQPFGKGSTPIGKGDLPAQDDAGGPVLRKVFFPALGDSLPWGKSPAISSRERISSAARALFSGTGRPRLRREAAVRRSSGGKSAGEVSALTPTPRTRLSTLPRSSTASQRMPQSFFPCHIRSLTHLISGENPQQRSRARRIATATQAVISPMSSGARAGRRR